MTVIVKKTANSEKHASNMERNNDSVKSAGSGSGSGKPPHTQTTVKPLTVPPYRLSISAAGAGASIITLSLYMA